MLRHLAILGFLATSAIAEPLPPVPSGQAVDLTELVFPEEHSLYLGITAPELSKFDFAVADQDIEVICKEYALPIARETGVSEVTIRLSEKPIPFGETDPDTPQFMGLYNVSEGRCLWH